MRRVASICSPMMDEFRPMAAARLPRADVTAPIASAVRGWAMRICGRRVLTGSLMVFLGTIGMVGS
jgi:hypothetical protein